MKYKITWKSFFGMLAGNIILGLGVAIFKFSGLGNDPFSAMMMALADLTPLDYAALAALLNTSIGRTLPFISTKDEISRISSTAPFVISWSFPF